MEIGGSHRNWQDISIEGRKSMHDVRPNWIFLILKLELWYLGVFTYYKSVEIWLRYKHFRDLPNSKMRRTIFRVKLLLLFVISVSKVTLEIVLPVRPSVS